MSQATATVGEFLITAERREAVTLPCLDCGVLLPPATRYAGLADPCHRCACGLWYSSELIATADWETWAFILHKRLLCRVGDHRYEHAGVVYRGEHGGPVPCPKHSGVDAESRLEAEEGT